jgi:hypothetical protein
MCVAFVVVVMGHEEARELYVLYIIVVTVGVVDLHENLCFF